MFMTHLEYNGYTGSIEYSQEDGVLFGKVLGIRGLISYEGYTGRELEQDFKLTVDDYLDQCIESGAVPEKPFKGSFNIRITSGLHRKATLMALQGKISLNSFVAEAIRSRVSE
jgi:predicted HicB family RNase H-like nuclease